MKLPLQQLDPTVLIKTNVVTFGQRHTPQLDLVLNCNRLLIVIETNVFALTDRNALQRLWANTVILKPHACIPVATCHGKYASISL